MLYQYFFLCLVRSFFISFGRSFFMYVIMLLVCISVGVLYFVSYFFMDVFRVAYSLSLFIHVVRYSVVYLFLYVLV